MTIRSVLLSNGRLCVTFDETGTMRELFFPVVGLLNHVCHGEGTGVFLWSGKWAPLFREKDEVTARYERGMVVTWKRAVSKSLPFDLVQDAVDPYVPVWVRSFVVSDFSGDITVFFRHRYAIGETTVGECAAWSPEEKRLYHYKGSIWIAHSLILEPDAASESTCSLGELEVHGVAAKVRDGGVRFLPDAPRVLGNPVDHGYVESAIGVSGSLRGPVRLNYVAALGSNKEDADRALDEGLVLGFSGISARTRHYWKRYLLPRGFLWKVLPGEPGTGAAREDCPTGGRPFAEANAASVKRTRADEGGPGTSGTELPRDAGTGESDEMWAATTRRTKGFEPPACLENLEYLYNSSLLIASAHWSENGAIVASCDDDIMTDYRDHYRYVWPRDAAMVANALLKCGITHVARMYLKFAAECIHERGFFWQRYRPDGTRGSGWHPWFQQPGSLPIQADETALTLMTAGLYLDATGDLDTLQSLYSSLIRPAAEFLCSYRHPDGQVVLASYDLWEERLGSFAFTQAATAAGLWSAAKISRALGIRGTGILAEAALDLLEGLVNNFSRNNQGIFRSPGELVDDASLFLIPVVLGESGLAEHERRGSGRLWKTLVETRSRVGRALFTGGGMARYSGDWYWRQENFNYPGNPWIITTVWYLQAGMVLGVLRPEDVLARYMSSPVLPAAAGADTAHETQEGEDVSQATDRLRGIELVSTDGQYSRRRHEENPELPVELRWFTSVASPSGAFPEQVHPGTLKPLSVMPLAWSHGCFLDLVNSLR
ncbi:MAG TPA: glycoside hydrolase family 15 protein [Firmicutes bacterium]|nr:glycoside hydrolase family 15 protein [Candidatus Fermentithermobacillaceae bacterium]